MSRTDDDVEELPLDSPDNPTTERTTTDGTTTTEWTERTEDGEEEQTETLIGEEEEPEFYYTEDFISKAYLSEDCNLPEDILVFEWVENVYVSFFDSFLDAILAIRMGMIAKGILIWLLLILGL